MDLCREHGELIKTVKRIDERTDQIQSVVCGGIDKTGVPIKGILSRVQTSETITKFLLSLCVPIIAGIVMLILNM